MFSRDFGLGQLERGGVSRELYVPVYGDEGHRAAQEDAQGLVVDEPIYLLAKLGELLRVGLDDGAAHQLFELGHGRPGAERA